MKIEWIDQYDFGDLMTMEKWLKLVEIGAFIDYDGYGHLATENKMSTIQVKPSDVAKGKIPDGFSHILWLNR